MGETTIRELTTETEWKEAFPVMKQLRSHLDENTYLSLVKESQEENNYRLFALYNAGQIMAVTGFMPMVTLYNDRFIWVCDLVTDQNHRSKNYGENLLSHVHDWAKVNGYKLVSLSSGLQRIAAHRFYQEKMAYDKTSYVFLKHIDADL